MSCRQLYCLCNINLAFDLAHHMKVTLSPFSLRIVFVFEIFEQLRPVKNYINKEHKVKSDRKSRAFAW